MPSPVTRMRAVWSLSELTSVRFRPASAETTLLNPAYYIEHACESTQISVRAFFLVKFAVYSHWKFRSWVPILIRALLFAQSACATGEAEGSKF